MEETLANLIKDNETADILKTSGYRIIQDQKKFKFGIDAMLLAHFAAVKKGNVCYDLGTGTGIIPLLLCGASENTKFTGLEIQEESFDMARRSIILNNLEDRITMVKGDIKEVPSLFPKAQADVVTSNPPYMINEHGKQNPNDYKCIARHEVLCTLEDVVKAAAHLLRPKGSFYLIHRPFRLSEIFVTMTRYGIEPKKMQLVQPFTDTAPNIVLIHGVKGGNSRITVEKPLIVYKEPGLYTDEINKIYSEI